MVVIAVIAILATIALFGLGQAQKAARDTQRQQIMNGLRAALERYNGDSSSYPNTTAFSAMMTILSVGGQLTALPVDPGCGGGKVTYPTSVGASNWTPCGTNSVVTYQYASGGSGTYTLMLYREGGGANSFISPQ